MAESSSRAPSTSSSESDFSISETIDIDETTDDQEKNGDDTKVRIKYAFFFEFKPVGIHRHPSAKCKLCQKIYKFTKNSKGNLLKHLQTCHPINLRNHKEEQAKAILLSQQTFSNNGRFVARPKEPFKNQDKIVTSIVRNLCGRGGLAISTVEKEWFRTFMNDVEPKFQPISRVAVSSMLDKQYEEEKQILLADIAKSKVDKPSVTVDFWTGCDTRSFMGCTIHFVHKEQLRSHVLFFVEVPPPHTAENIKHRFEDELENHGLSCFKVITDNAANMKCAFEINHNEAGSLNESVDEQDDEEGNPLSQWTQCELKIEGWLGCAAHKLQLVVNDGYKELKGYRRIQSVFAKAKAVASLSHRSSHFAYSLSVKIPMPCETRWNSYLHLHEHIVKHFDQINSALQAANRSDLIISTLQRDMLSHVVDVMQYFAEATNILQGEKFPTSNKVIPVVDSLENALLDCRRDTACINALCESLLTSLRRRFKYLLHSPIHQAATALDPSIKLSFTDHDHRENKVFVFSSDDVKESVKSFLPRRSQSRSNSADVPVPLQPAKKPRLLDFCSVSNQCSSRSTITTANDADIEFQMYCEQPRLDVDPLMFWAQRRDTQLSIVALRLISVPCSSAPVERLFSKAGVILNQRRTRTASSKLEKLIFLK